MPVAAKQCLQPSCSIVACSPYNTGGSAQLGYPALTWDPGPAAPTIDNTMEHRTHEKACRRYDARKYDLAVLRGFAQRELPEVGQQRAMASCLPCCPGSLSRRGLGPTWWASWRSGCSGRPRTCASSRSLLRQLCGFANLPPRHVSGLRSPIP